MNKQLRIKFLSIITLIALSINVMNAQIKITEVMSSSGTGGTNDWIELTNLGTAEVNITGWKMDDSSYAIANAVAFVGVTSIPAGKSIILLETDNPSTDIPTFKTFWGSSLDAVSVGSYPSSGKGVGLGSGGDGVIIFDASGTEIQRVTVPAATAGSTFTWVYNADFSVQASATVSTVGTILGTSANQVSITSANVLGNIGSPGTAVVGGLSTNVPNTKYSLKWKLIENVLTFNEMPQTNVEIYSATGNKIAEFAPKLKMELKLQKGVYIVRANNSAGKIITK